MVVKQRELFQRRLQCSSGWNHQLAQQRFQGSKQTLDASVVPRRASLDALMSMVQVLWLPRCAQPVV